jgi:hypothetical protein
MSPCCWLYFFAQPRGVVVVESGGRRRRQKKNHPSHRVQPTHHHHLTEGPSTSSFATRTHQLNAACCGWLLLPLPPSPLLPRRRRAHGHSHCCGVGCETSSGFVAARDNLFVANNLRRVGAAAADSSASNVQEAASLATLSCRVLVAQIALTSFSNCLTSPHDACLPAAMISVQPYLNICS